MYLLAASVPISLAAINVSKLLILLVAAGVLIGGLLGGRRQPLLAQSRSVRMVLVMLAALAFSLVYTTAPWHEALGDVAKYGKLLLIPAVLLLIRSPREARMALGLYLGVQAFVVLTSCLLYLHVPVFWVPSTPRNSIATVYSSYLDQTIMTAAFAAVCWHLRASFPGRQGRWLALGLAAISAVNILFMMPGRSGQMALLGVISLALLWAVPRRWLAAAFLAPVLLVGLTMAVSPQFKVRLTEVVSEVNAYQSQQDIATSSGMRLNFWRRSLEAIAQRPFTGFGVGSWNQQYLRLEGPNPIPGTAKVRNPHQEFLLWGVHLGLGGILLLLAFFAAAVRDSQRFAPTAQHAMQSVLAVMAIACLFNSAVFDALIGEFFCVLTGLLLAYGQQTLTASDPVPRTAGSAEPVPA
ncbi:MAG: O-antigen ligase family protein [Ramlibacter sp.]|nr:O-antigen ligase family protein [Ramlibacter sp.]